MFRVLLSCLPNGKTMLWMCTKSQKGDNHKNLDFHPDFVRIFTKMSPDEELVTLLIPSIISVREKPQSLKLLPSSLRQWNVRWDKIRFKFWAQIIWFPSDKRSVISPNFVGKSHQKFTLTFPNGIFGPKRAGWPLHYCSWSYPFLWKFFH